MSDLLSDRQRKEIIDAAIDQIKADVANRASSAFAYQVESVLADRINKIVTEYVGSEIKPLILCDLEKHKSVLVDAAVASAESMAQLLAKSMTEKLSDNLSKSYNRSEIFKALFG